MLTLAVTSLYVIQSLVSIMLIHGIRKMKPFLMLPYMAYVGAVIIFYFVGAAFYQGFHTTPVSHPLIFFGLLGILVIVETCCLLVVRSHYLELKRGKGDSIYKILQEC